MSKPTDTKFYNTVNLTGKERDEALIRVETQADRILELFRGEPAGLTHAELRTIYIALHEEIQVSSVYRAVSDLTDSGFLVKTDAKRMGKHGVVNYVWKIA